MPKKKLVLLYGFPGIGKTTITQRYINEHPLTLGLEGDKILAMIGQWADHDKESDALLFELNKAIVSTYLKSGHDVIMPILPRTRERIESFENIAHEAAASLYEIALTTDREDAISRLMERGTWGEENAPLITAADLPRIEQMYTDMCQTLAARDNLITIVSMRNDLDLTYNEFMAALD